MLFEFAKSMQGHLGGFILPSLQALLGMVTDIARELLTVWDKSLFDKVK
jgi:hypothetical protein